MSLRYLRRTGSPICGFGEMWRIFLAVYHLFSGLPQEGNVTCFGGYGFTLVIALLLAALLAKLYLEVQGDQKLSLSIGALAIEPFASVPGKWLLLFSDLRDVSISTLNAKHLVC